MNYRSEFLIGATRSGSGKTLLTLGLLAALSRRGVKVQPFKCGPDFIDPTLHELMTDRPSINLDLHMMGEEECRKSFRNHGEDAEVALIEGVMGLFDGGSASSAALADTLGVPVLLVIDVRSAAESIAAVLKGFELYSEKIHLCGVIFNRVGSARHRELIETAVNESCSTRILGFFPRDVNFELPSRHLGLHMGHEISYSSELLDNLVNAVEEHISVETLLQKTSICRSEGKRIASPVKHEKTVRIAVARDEAFCFYYHENFSILEASGFEIVPFSPLHDSSLPNKIQGVYLGGGYPELHAQELSANSAMLDSMREWADNDGFIYGECGGFMYLTESLVDTEGIEHGMTGIFPLIVKMQNRLSRLGYRKVQLRADSPLGRKGTQFYGHEFHYSSVIRQSSSITPLWEGAEGGDEGCRQAHVFGSYVHLHFARNLESIQYLEMYLKANSGIR